MSEENIIDLQKFAKNLGIDVDASRICKSKRSYPREWKELCLEIVKAYKDQKSKELGRTRLGWLWMRNKIMEPFDIQRPDGSVIPNPDLPELTRQNLESWELSGSLSDPKFEYIDYFVRNLSVDGSEFPAFHAAKRSVDSFHMAAFSRLYQPKRKENLDAEAVAAHLGNYQVSGSLLNTWFKYIVVKIEFVSDGIIKAIFAYCPFDIYHFSETEAKNAVFYEAYLAPILSFLPDDSPEYEGDRIFLGCNCLTKLFRPEFRGHHIRGYADGEIEIHFQVNKDMEILYSATYLDAPNTLMAPSVFTKTISHREEKATVIQESDLRQHHADKYGFLDRARSPTDMNMDFKYKLYGSSEMTVIDKNIEEKLALIFDRNYRGYLF